MKTLENLIAEHPFWRGIPARYVPVVAGAASFERFAPGHLIFHEGSESTHLYLIERGHVALETFVALEGVVVLDHMGPGEALGWSWLFPPGRCQFSARSTDATEAISLCGYTLRTAAEQDPAFGYELATRIARLMSVRLQALRTKLVEFYEADCKPV